MRKRYIAITCLAVSPYLLSCNSSDRVRSEDIVLVLTAAVLDNNVSLEASLRQRLSDSIVVDVSLDSEDKLYIENKDSSESINLADDGELNYSGSITQNIGYDVRLVFNKTTTDEVLSTKIDIPFFYRSLTSNPGSEFRSSENLISLNWIVDSLDGATAPSVGRLNSSIMGCVDNLDTQIDVSGVRQSSEIAALNRESILEQTSIVSSDQIAYLVNDDVPSTIQYCDFEISLASNWFVRWDGSQPPTGVAGPVWISPDSKFGNGDVPGDDPNFGITVNANPTSVRIFY